MYVTSCNCCTSSWISVTYDVAGEYVAMATAGCEVGLRFGFGFGTRGGACQFD